ncbi:uncharacterized protein PpBr36_11046 [Pyricularia pennisetigena]|uniref:uncharacterized protein n=1 Tax=Pyricularia pennisetigena TaxID=1578925 RepID=UPI001150F6AB|nr:uncharacterized protein PpBr36_11046 [Pyricularia pennisetigena]TLS20773.1 hypothetical protein PpBr36_11046 [Pyricularia pennisetigena]
MPKSMRMLIMTHVRSDYNSGYLETLGFLTEVGEVSRGQLEECFDQMAQRKDTYYNVVIEDTTTKKVVATGTVVVELKFIHGISKAAHLEDVVVAEEYQKMGLGLHIHRARDFIVMKTGCYKGVLDCCDYNVGFHKKAGYEECALNKMEHNVDEHQLDDPAIADSLFNTQAVKRFQDLIIAWRKYNDGRPNFKVDGEKSLDTVAETFKLGLKLDQASAIRVLLSYLSFIQADEQLTNLTPSRRKTRPEPLLRQAYAALKLRPDELKFSSFQSRLSRARSLNSLKGLIAFLPFTERGKVGVRRFESSNPSLQSYIEAHTHYQELLQAGNEFIDSILLNVELPKRIWEDHSFGQDLPLENQIRLLRVKAPDLPSEYELDEHGHIVTVQPIIPPTPPPGPTPPLATDGHASTGNCANGGSSRQQSRSTPDEPKRKTPLPSSPPSVTASSGHVGTGAYTTGSTASQHSLSPPLLPSPPPSEFRPSKRGAQLIPKSAFGYRQTDTNALKSTSANPHSNGRNPLHSAGRTSAASSGGDATIEQISPSKAPSRDGVAGTNTGVSTADSSFSQKRPSSLGSSAKKQKLSHSETSISVVKISPWLNDALSPSSMARLKPGQQLNDAIVNAYMLILAQRHGTCFVNSHFLNRHLTSVWKAEHGDPLDTDLALMPVEENYHWYLLAMYKRPPSTKASAQDDRVICFLDSLPSSRSYDSAFTQWEKHLKSLGNCGYIHRKSVKVPRQDNRVDCGVFNLAFAQKILENPQQFADAVEKGTALDWEINADIFRESIRATLISANNGSTPLVPPTETVEGDDLFMDSVEVGSACLATNPLVWRPATIAPSATDRDAVANYMTVDDETLQDYIELTEAASNETDPGNRTITAPAVGRPTALSNATNRVVEGEDDIMLDAGRDVGNPGAASVCHDPDLHLTDNTPGNDGVFEAAHDDIRDNETTPIDTPGSALSRTRAFAQELDIVLTKDDEGIGMIEEAKVED